MKLLLVEDEHTLAVPLGDALMDAGHEVTVLGNGAAALAWLDEQTCDLVVTDVRLPGAEGNQVLARARKLDPPADIIVMTGYATVEQAVSAMSGGAFSYLQKPFPLEVLLALVERVQAMRAMQVELNRLRGWVGDSPKVPEGSSALAAGVRKKMKVLADADGTILLGGESGTGKSTVAKAIHDASSRSAEPFFVIHCGSLQDALLEGEFFGHVKGAFTGADQDRPGLFSQVGGGTLLLEEVEDLSASGQAALLRVLQEGLFRPLGGNEESRFQGRVMASSRKDLSALVREGKFREDLYFRLAVLSLNLPNLRERAEDIPALLATFLRQTDPSGTRKISNEAMNALARYNFPGNIRELENAVNRALALAGRAQKLGVAHLFPGGPIAVDVVGPEDIRPIREVVRSAEREAIRQALAVTKGRKAEAAELLGISRKALWKKTKELGLA